MGNASRILFAKLYAKIGEIILKWILNRVAGVEASDAD